MSQIDKIHFIPTLIWVLIGYLCWYCFILIFFVPKYYKVLRSRYFLELNLLNKINSLLSNLALKQKFFFLWKNIFLNNIFLKYYLFMFRLYIGIISK